MLKVINVVGARPNFMKVAPIVAAMKQRAAHFDPLLIHTGQHYDAAMSDAFFRDLDLPKPDTYLGVGSGSHAAQTAAVMERFEPVVLQAKLRPIISEPVIAPISLPHQLIVPSSPTSASK